MNKFIKRGLPLFMAGLISISMLPPPISALAANSVGSVASDVDAAAADIEGQDTEQNKHTEYQNSAAGSSSVDTKHTEVYAYLDNGDVLVKIPKVVILSGTPDSNGDYKGLYTVEIQQESDFAGNEKITVVPDETVTLTQKGKASIDDAAIAQTKTEFSYAEAIEGDNNTAIGTVSTDALTAGSWKGVFDFNVSLRALTEYTWNQMNAPVTNYMNNVTYDPSDYSYSEIQSYAPDMPVAANSKPVGKTITLPAGTLSVTDYGSGITTTKAVSAGEHTFYNITPDIGGEFKVTDNSGTILEEGILRPTGQVRLINTNAANVRDLGGWQADGGTIKYGKLYRGGELSNSDINVLVNQLGIKHELDLRGSEDAGRNYSLLGNSVQYTVLDDYIWYDVSEEVYDYWYDILNTIFDNAISGDPLYFHCQAGADRTATVAYIIEALLGMKQSDIDKDYELSSFHTGSGREDQIRSRNKTDWKQLIAGLQGYGGQSLRDKAVSFCLKVGITAEKINAFREAMIDGDSEPLIIVNTVLNKSDTSNALSVITVGGSYQTTITPKNGYIISSVTVNMNNTDITASSVILENDGTGATISIPSVTHNCTIVVNTETATLTNLLTMNDNLINKRIQSDGSATAADGYFVTDYMPFDYSSSRGIRIVNGNTQIGNLGSTTNYQNCKICFYDINKNLICQYYISRSYTNNFHSKFIVDGNDLVKHNIALENSSVAVAGLSAPSDWNSVKYIRLCLALDNATTAIGSASDITNSNLAIYFE